MTPTPNSHDETWPELATDIGTPEFEALWKLMKSWDINVPEQYVGYSECTGSHVQAILNALKATHPSPVSADGERVLSKQHEDNLYLSLQVQIAERVPHEVGGNIASAAEAALIVFKDYLQAARTSPSIGEGGAMEQSLETYTANIYMAGDINQAKQVLREFVLRGFCVTVMPLDFIYTGGEESGFRVGLTNYPKFPSTPKAIAKIAEELAELLKKRLFQ